MNEQPIRGLFPDPEGNGPSIHTVYGRRFYVLNPREEDVDIEEIAQALCNICRWTGQLRRRYSVAAHSMFVSLVLLEKYGRPRLALLGLMHDAHEAYLGDISRPVKFMMEQVAPGVLKSVDERLEECVANALDLHATDEEKALIKWADDLAMAAEGRDLMRGEKPWMVDLPDPYGYELLRNNPRPHEFEREYRRLVAAVESEARRGGRDE